METDKCYFCGKDTNKTKYMVYEDEYLGDICYKCEIACHHIKSEDKRKILICRLYNGNYISLYSKHPSEKEVKRMKQQLKYCEDV